MDKQEFQLSRDQIVYLLDALESPVMFGNRHPTKSEKLTFITGFPNQELRFYPEDDLTELDVCKAVNQLASQFKTENEDRHPDFFISGIIGYLSYDIGEAFKLGLIRQGKGSSQEQLLAYAGYYSWSLSNNNEKHTWQLNFGENCSSELRQQITSILKSINENRSIYSPAPFKSLDWQSSISSREYGDAFDAIKNYLLMGDCYQVNFAQAHQSHFGSDRTSAFYWYLDLQDQLSAPYSAMIELEGNHRIYSYSPEQFISVKGSDIESAPIKGTVKNTGNKNDTKRLSTSLKDQAENLMIVDLIRNDLGKLCITGSIEVSELFKIHTFKNVHHLISKIRGKLKPEITPIEALISAFPGGSITGAPKIRSMEIIGQLEAQPRGAYCGTLFYLDQKGNMDSNILIRTAEEKDNRLICWGGGGIVFDSVKESEYQESIYKIAGIIGRSL